ncbi:MAG TPA: hypothetical protein VG936_07160 [Lacunisphaera sp.]|nr:hypothetical protein [Lacunisphaera sp.]
MTTTTPSPKEIVAGYAIAAIALAAGPVLGLAAGDPAFTIFVRGFGLLALGIVLKYTFALGRLRGFAAHRADGALDLTNSLRCLVASMIVMFALAWLAAALVAPFVHSN